MLLLLLRQIPEDIQAVQVPLQFICAENDAQFPERTRTSAQQLLEQKSPGRREAALYGPQRRPCIHETAAVTPFSAAIAHP
jgi:hypothetical protein